MNVSVDLQVACEDDDHPPPPRIEQWVKAALTYCANNSPDNTSAKKSPADDHSNDIDAELTVRIVDEQEIRELNSNYRDIDKPTNVLSFPADIPDHIDLPLLGDLIICAAVVAREAREQQKSLENHWAHMIVHGCLHLLGYDHVDDEDADIMEALEVSILADLNIANPYDITEISDHSHPTKMTTTNNTVNL